MTDDIDAYEVTTPPQGDPIRFPVTMTTLRDRFAMAALTGLLSQYPYDPAKIQREDMTKTAYDFADSMLEARKTTPEPEAEPKQAHKPPEPKPCACGLWTCERCLVFNGMRYP